MSYHSDVTGEMTFSRPLKKSEMKSPELTQAIKDSYLWQLKQETAEHVVEVEGETAIVFTTKAIGLKMSEYLDDARAIGYNWDAALQRIITALPEDVMVSGYFQAEGERDGYGYTAERLYVVDGDVVVTKPTVMWPETPEGAVA